MRSAILIDDSPTPFERTVASLRVQASLKRVLALIGDDAEILGVGVRTGGLDPVIARTDGHEVVIDDRFALSSSERTLDQIVQHEMLHALVVLKAGHRIPVRGHQGSQR